MKDRTNLPFRKNCEGYFLCKNGKVIAQDTKKGYVEFPGGGVDKGEHPEIALIREAHEEAGIILDGDLKKVGQINFVWGPNWAKTEKQKKRYKEFQGEEMHFFIGKVKELISPKGDLNEEGWKNEVHMEIKDIMTIIKNEETSDETLKEYREFQIKMIEELSK